MSIENDIVLAMMDEFRFKAKISKMGTKRQIIIPTALHEILKDNEFEDVPLIVTVKKDKDEDENPPTKK